jgi:hypothetical protein
MSIRGRTTTATQTLQDSSAPLRGLLGRLTSDIMHRSWASLWHGSESLPGDGPRAGALRLGLATWC